MGKLLVRLVRSLANVTDASGRAGRALIEYIDSGTSGLLQVYESAAGQIPGALQHVRQLTADNPTQQGTSLGASDGLIASE
jgi:ABC-type transporter Mla subunit MlaD